MSWDDYQTRMARGEMQPIPAHPWSGGSRSSAPTSAACA